MYILQDLMHIARLTLNHNIHSENITINDECITDKTHISSETLS